MAKLYADENFNAHAVVELQNLGHDVLTALQAGQANKKTPDDQVLAFAVSLQRAVLTHDTDYPKLHRKNPIHCGIVFCTDDVDFAALAQRIHQALMANPRLDNKLIRVPKPAIP